MPDRRWQRLLCAALCVLSPLAPGVAAARGATPAVGTAGTVRGAVVSVGWSELTVQLPGRRVPALSALTLAADRLADADYPYVWGGGHAFAGTASTGMRGGPGYNGRRVGFDCSGSVAAVLAGAGIWPAGTGVPADGGVIATLRRERLIARGAGRGTRSVTLWDDPGTHIFMEIGDRFFGTSDGGLPSPENPRGGPGWLDDGAPDTSMRAYRPWHLLPAALAERVSAGRIVTLALSRAAVETLGTLTIGDRVRAGYVTRHRELVATAIVAL